MLQKTNLVYEGAFVRFRESVITLCQIKYGIVLFLFIAVSCKSRDTRIQSVEHLQQAFLDRDEQLFLEQFPKDYEMFVSYFGFEKGAELNADIYAPLYEDSYNYIKYWFSLLEKPEHKAYEKQLISICTNAIWQVDGVNYFQDQTLDYIKENKRYDLVNNLTDVEAHSVLSLLFGSPHGARDTDFIEHLSPSKKQHLLKIFEDSAHTNHSNKPLSYYLENDAYFTKDIDLNGDGILDKIVCHKPYEGEDLLLFLNKEDSYALALHTINFSEDGGNQVRDIKATESGIVVNTLFPDRGLSEASHYINHNDEKQWMLSYSIYKSLSSNEPDASVYICEVEQNIPLDDVEALQFIKDIPVEGERDMVCYKEENIGKKALPLHGALTSEKVNLYYPKLLNELGNEGVVYTEPLNIETQIGIIPTLLTYTTITKDYFVYTHNADFDVIDVFYIGQSTDFDNGTSQTIDYEYLENNQILFKKTNWGYVDKDHSTIDTLALERTFVEISEEGDIHYDISKDPNFYSLELYVRDSSGSETNIRNSPNGKVVLTLGQKEDFIVTTTQSVDGWFKIYHILNASTNKNVILPDGVGWIHHTVLGAHTRQTVYVMAQPKKGKSIVAIPQETEIKILDKKNDWVSIAYGTLNGWTKADLLCGSPYTTCP